MEEILNQRMNYPYLKNINISRGYQGRDSSETELVLDFIDYEHSDILRFYFFGVTDIKLNLNILSTVRIAIIDNSDQMENINYRVLDEEEEVFLFNCKSYVTDAIRN